MEEFDKFWSAYPKKLSKGDARKAWIQTARIRPSLEAILEAVDKAKTTDQWTRDGGQFIPYPASWLRAERWEDVHEIEVEKKDTRPSITCSECKQKAYFWTNGKCSPCWRKEMAA